MCMYTQVYNLRNYCSEYPGSDIHPDNSLFSVEIPDTRATSFRILAFILLSFVNFLNINCTRYIISFKMNLKSDASAVQSRDFACFLAASDPVFQPSHFLHYLKHTSPNLQDLSWHPEPPFFNRIKSDRNKGRVPLDPKHVEAH